jgi:hypothetical protein
LGSRYTIKKWPQIGDEMSEEMGKWQSEAQDLRRSLEGLRKAIRAHRDARGDDRCWLDDEELYKLLPEGYTPPVRDTSVELERCKQFIENRQNPVTIYVSPERELERLRAAFDHVTATFDEYLVGEVHHHGGIPQLRPYEQTFREKMALLLAAEFRR